MATSRDLLRIKVAPRGMGPHVYEPIPRAEFDEVLDQVKRWGLDQFLKERSFENLIYRAAP